MLSADAFSAFEEAGLENESAIAETGRRFRDTVLSLGGGRAPALVFKVLCLLCKDGYVSIPSTSNIFQKYVLEVHVGMKFACKPVDMLAMLHVCFFLLSSTAHLLSRRDSTIKHAAVLTVVIRSAGLQRTGTFH